MFGAPHPVTASASASPLVPLPRRPLDESCQVRRWYERELGWPTVPGDPVRLAVGARFDVLDVPAEAGHAALWRLGPGSPVAVRGDRMLLLVAAGSAEELPGLLEWLEWGSLALDLVAIGAGGSVEAPVPAGVRGAGGANGVRGAGGADGVRGAGGADGVRGAGRVYGAGGVPPCVTDASSRCGVGGPSLPGQRASPVPPGAAVAPAPDRAVPSRPGAGSFTGRTLPPGPVGSQGAAVWLRPPEPGCEVEASLPTLSALGGGGGAPDLVRLVDTVATHCHRVRLRRACAQPALRAQGQ
ncbi:SCO3374 family protein [Streptomyces sp. NPDC050546]|uniref:SCO3374 family protein n=1 Tax=Streptomyces sp. NPDC050546 TaxID=3365628 RepID=UPI00379592A6